ncbi:MAG TPA: DUF4136 domain-containing protein [Cyclobacteriaceae bacterium]|jgi:hypothetical protein|nr:DUF4136 domain-containing protein [Cyclobacteriaceae bacterium]
MKRSITPFNSIIYILLVFTIVGSVPAWSQIKISKAKGVKISKYETFAVIQGQVVSADMSKHKELQIFEMVKEAVTKQMTLRGYQEATDSTAQLVISYLYDVTAKLTPRKAGPLGQTPVDDPTAIDASNYKVSNETRVLILDITENKSSVWTANCTMNSVMKDISKLFDVTIESAYKRFPVQGKGK